MLKRLGPGLIAMLAAGLVATFGFTTWLLISNPGSAESTLDGWGAIGGVDGMGAENINDVIASLDGVGTYRPALPSTALAVVALLVAGWLVVTRSKVAAAAVAGCALLIAGWGVFRGLAPGDVAGILAEGEYRAGPGAWLVVVAALAMLAPAMVVLVRPAGQVDSPTRSRGIQPRR